MEAATMIAGGELFALLISDVLDLRFFSAFLS